MAPQPQTTQERRKSFSSQNVMRRKSISISKTYQRRKSITQLPQRKKSMSLQSPSGRFWKQILTTTSKNLHANLRAKMLPNLIFTGVELTAKALCGYNGNNQPACSSNHS
uniref:Uncharacterized protein n=1 Tax=Acrobeloides nanus TaxID=290746 RepID=A0A914ELK7_9BILA